MDPDTTDPPSGSSDDKRKRRWPLVLAGLLVVTAVAVGTWQMVDMHRQISDLQATDHRQQSQLNGFENSFVHTVSPNGLSLVQLEGRVTGIEGHVSQIERTTTDLDSRISCLTQALKDATVKPDGTLFVKVIC